MMCRYLNMVRDVAPGAAPVLFMLLIRIVSKDVYLLLRFCDKAYA